jgi:hypothetical protein
MNQKRQPCSNRELKLTAALYASRQRIVDHVRATGRLPEELNLGGAHIGARLLVEARGTDITLTPDERLVYDAILRDGRLPGGAVRLVEPPPTDPDRLEEPLFRAREMKLGAPLPILEGRP